MCDCDELVCGPHRATGDGTGSVTPTFGPHVRRRRVYYGRWLVGPAAGGGWLIYCYVSDGEKKPKR